MKNKQRGFTLIELLVVVLIIGILAAVALPQYQIAVQKTRSMRLLPLLRAISDAENVYFLENGVYTLSFQDLSIDMPAGATEVSERVLKYSNFSCYLQENGSSGFSAYCNDSSRRDVPRIEKYFQKSTFICWAEDEFAGKVCHSISGKSDRDMIVSGKDGYRF